MENILKKNLANIDYELDLFGNKIEKLSMQERIGFVPLSIWEPDWNIVNQLKPIIGDSGESRELVGNKMKLMGSKYETSIFNPHLAQMILSSYCPEKAKIYDPFSGGGTRGFIATAMGHDYYGVELRREEVDRIKNQMVKLDKKFHLLCGDSTNFYTDELKFDFIYTCPPYYNLEIYSNNQNDLSAQKTYQCFLNLLSLTIGNCFKMLDKNKLCVFVVGNFRDKNGELIHFNGDIVKIGKLNGFILHDEIIFWGASKCAAQRAGQFEANRKSVRVHESVIIFKKP